MPLTASSAFLSCSSLDKVVAAATVVAASVVDSAGGIFLASAGTLKKLMAKITVAAIAAIVAITCNAPQ